MKKLFFFAIICSVFVANSSIFAKPHIQPKMGPIIDRCLAWCIKKYPSDLVRSVCPDRCAAEAKMR